MYFQPLLGIAKEVGATLELTCQQEKPPPPLIKYANKKIGELD